MAATLERLETKGFVSSSLGEPTSERGGRAKRLFRIEADGGASGLAERHPQDDGWLAKTLGSYVSHHHILRLGTWLLGRLLPAAHREAVLGDLVEEYGIRARSGSAPNVARWYWGQICRSIPPMLWAAVRRGAWLSTLGVALGAYVAAGMIEFACVTAMSSLLDADARSVPVFGAIVGLATIVAGGYFAASIRPRAATALAGIVFIAVVVLMVTMSDSAPLWYQLTFLLAGPLAALIGGTVYFTRRARRAGRVA